MNVCSEYFALNNSYYNYYYIVDRRFQDIDSTNNNVSYDETSFDIEESEK